MNPPKTKGIVTFYSQDNRIPPVSFVFAAYAALDLFSLAASDNLDAIRAIQDKSIKTFARAIFATRMLSRL